MERNFFDWAPFRKVSVSESREGAEANCSHYSVGGEMDPKESFFEAIQSAHKEGNRLYQKGNRLRGFISSLRRCHPMIYLNLLIKYSV
jgi:hypothetical protein